METEVTTTINAARNAVWKTITDIENAAQNISAIEKVEVLEKPKAGLLGFKWRETRTMFGKTATEVMWITEVAENERYATRAESHGSIYTTLLSLQEKNGATQLTMRFTGTPVTLGAKVMWTLMGFMFAGATQKALAQDLADIKAAVERGATP